MSRHMSLHFSVTDQHATYQRFKSILEMCCEAGQKSILAYFMFGEIRIDKNFVRQIKHVERDMRKRFRFSIKYSIICQREQINRVNLREAAIMGFKITLMIDDMIQLRKFRRLIKKIERYVPGSELYVKNYTRLTADLITYYKCHMPLRFEIPEIVDADFLELFDNWVFLKDHPELGNYTDLLKVILLNEQCICEYDSCLGRVLSVDSSGVVYWCKYNRAETAIMYIDELSSFYECFKNESFEKYLDAHYKKRERCKAECNCFRLCQSGCPLRCDINKALFDCSEHVYINAINHLAKKMRQYIGSGDLTLINESIRKIVLNVIAFEPFSDFFKLCREEEEF